MLNNIYQQSSQNIFVKQPQLAKNQNQRNARDEDSQSVLQDKGALTSARVASAQPGPVDKQSRAQALYSKTTRAQKRATTRVKLIHTTLWLHPLVRAEFERIAEREKLSVSSVGASACEEWVRYDIHRQQSAILETKMRQLIREENRALGNRIVFFLMRIAFASEQARILISNVLKWVLTLAGVDQKSYYTMVDDSSKMARRNIITKTPQLKSLLEEWEHSFIDPREEETYKANA